MFFTPKTNCPNCGKSLASNTPFCTACGAAMPTPAAGQDKGGWKKTIGGLGVLGMFLWKFKGAALLLLGKAKFLILGLTKVKTLFSMLAFFGVYWAQYGWPWAAGIVISIYIHEMGHVAKLRSYGVEASAPMFIPFLGAFITMKEAPKSPGEEARIGLWGPLYGVATALAAWALGVLTGYPILFAIARTGATINLFNLIPVWQLDGGHAYKAFDRDERWICCGAALFFGLLSGNFLFFFVAAAGAWQAWKGEPGPGDKGAMGLQLVLLAIIAAIEMLIPAMGRGARVF